MAVLGLKLWESVPVKLAPVRKRHLSFLPNWVVVVVQSACPPLDLQRKVADCFCYHVHDQVLHITFLVEYWFENFYRQVCSEFRCFADVDLFVDLCMGVY